ncbi:hypothetical protein ABT008_17030 [Micromonospora sp. NPDC002389]|uniref:hypothetical protein n=1 Tax=Micromonospora sp. NPDC002389 TaxID=3154272 RepID=UPI0033246406
MLDGLDEIEWRRLGHAYGAADDVPGRLRDLTSPDPDLRIETLGSLYTTIVHQGNRFQASAYAVPFLLELLADPAVPERGDVVGLLAALAIGQDATVLPDGVPVAAFRRAAEGGRELLAATPPPREYVEYAYLESLSEADRDRLWAYTHLAVYDAVRAGVPLLRRLLDEADPGLHVPAAYALAWFPEEAAGSLPALAGAMAGAGPAGRATMLVAGGLLGAAPDVGLRDDPDPRVRWAAAVGRARVLGARADEATAETLLTWAADPPDEAAPDDGWVPFLDGDLAGYAALALRQLGPGYADRAFDALLHRLPGVDGERALTVLGEALRSAFPDGPLPAGTPATALTSRQRRLAETLAQATDPWLIDGVEFGNVSMLVTEHGLPRSRVALRGHLD